jgi:hypothetical protein
MRNALIAAILLATTACTESIDVPINPLVYSAIYEGHVRTVVYYRRDPNETSSDEGFESSTVIADHDKVEIGLYRDRCRIGITPDALTGTFDQVPVMGGDCVAINGMTLIIDRVAGYFGDSGFFIRVYAVDEDRGLQVRAYADVVRVHD